MNYIYRRCCVMLWPPGENDNSKEYAQPLTDQSLLFPSGPAWVRPCSALALAADILLCCGAFSFLFNLYFLFFAHPQRILEIYCNSLCSALAVATLRTQSSTQHAALAGCARSMGRKRKRKSGASPLRLSPSLHPAARSQAPSISRATPQASTKRSGASTSSSSTTAAASCSGSAAELGGDSRRGATPTVPTAPKFSARSQSPRAIASNPVGASAPPPRAPRQSSGSAPKHKRDHTPNSSKTAAVAAEQAEKAAGTQHKPNQPPTHRQPLAHDGMGKGSGYCAADGGMSASEVLAKILPLSGWRLGDCWGRDCPCAAFIPRPAIASKGAAVCSCGHRSVAHELVDAREEVVPGGRSRYRWYGGNFGAEKAGASAEDLGAGMRRLFSAIRNARAVGDCGLFEDSEGLRGWGAGWFLSR